jgi:uncharacterized protein HemY
MEKETTSVLKLLGVTAAIFVLIDFSMGNNSNDFHVHDTYIVMSSVTKLFIFLIFSVFVGSLIASILTKFKNKLYVKTLIFSTLLIFSAGIYIFSLFVKIH